jgi:hypothetical protein
MGAVDTMELFFERLNAGDREGAVALMDDTTEMRVHVGDSVQTLRGVERVGGWFLRGDTGLRMIPGALLSASPHFWPCRTASCRDVAWRTAKRPLEGALHDSGPPKAKVVVCQTTRAWTIAPDRARGYGEGLRRGATARGSGSGSDSTLG